MKATLGMSVQERDVLAFGLHGPGVVHARGLPEILIVSGFEQRSSARWGRSETVRAIRHRFNLVWMECGVVIPGENDWERWGERFSYLSGERYVEGIRVPVYVEQPLHG